MRPKTDLRLDNSIVIVWAQQCSRDDLRLAARGTKVIDAQQAIGVDHGYQVVAKGPNSNNSFNILRVELRVYDTLSDILLEFALNIIVRVLRVEGDLRYFVLDEAYPACSILSVLILASPDLIY